MLRFLIGMGAGVVLGLRIAHRQQELEKFNKTMAEAEAIIKAAVKNSSNQELN